MKDHLTMAALGLAMGAVLSFIGFSDFTEVHRMFTFQDLRLIWTFAGTVLFSGLAFAVLQRGNRPPRTEVDWTAAVGGLIFGVGWAVCGACPSTSPIQLGEGKLPAVLTAVGVFGGNWLCSKLQQRYSFSASSCVS